MHVRRAKKKPRSSALTAIELQSTPSDTARYEPYHSGSRGGYAGSALAARVRDAERVQKHQCREIWYLELAASSNGVNANIDGSYITYYDPVPPVTVVPSGCHVGPLIPTKLFPSLDTRDDALQGQRGVIDAVVLRGYLDFAHAVPLLRPGTPRAVCRLALVYFVDFRALNDDVDLVLPVQSTIWTSVTLSNNPLIPSQRLHRNLNNALVLWERTYRGGIDDDISAIPIHEVIPVNLPIKADHRPIDLSPTIPYTPQFMSVASTRQGLLCLYALSDVEYTEATEVPYFKLSSKCYFH